MLLDDFADGSWSYAGLKLAYGEVLSPEEEAALKLAEAEFERVQRGKDAELVFVDEPFLMLQVRTDWY